MFLKNFLEKIFTLIINDIKSDSIEQAIFILRTPKKEHENYRINSSIAGEAQNIINSYVRAAAPSDSYFKKQYGGFRRRKRIFYVLLALGALCGLFLLSGVGYRVVDAIIASLH